MARKYKVRQTGEYFSVRCASTANVAVATGLEAGDAIDGVTLVEGDFVLLKNQTTGAENGIYRAVAAAAGAASRPNSSHRSHREYGTGFDVGGTVVVVREGTANAGKVFLCYTEPAVVGTNALTYIETDHPTKR